MHCLWVAIALSDGGLCHFSICLYYLFDGHCGVSWLLLMCRWRPLHCPLVATASKLDGAEGERHHAGPAGDCSSVWGTDAYPLC